MDRPSESHLQEFLWVQEFQALHLVQVYHPDRADQVVRGIQCHPSLP